MRRINASRPIAGRRSTRRRRAIAPAVPAGQRRPKLRTLVTPVIAGAGLLARQLLCFGRSTFATFKSMIPFGIAARRITERVRAAYSTLRTGLSAGLAFAWAWLSAVRALDSESLSTSTSPLK